MRAANLADGPGHGAVSDAHGLRLLKLSIGAVGVVYGDIGTSPLYAVRECFHQVRDDDGNLIHGILATEHNVLGILSLFFWSLTVVIVIKYLIFVLRADNQGEGGTLALLAAILPKSPAARRTATLALLTMLALFGSALLFGEGIITPAISVLSAVEGLTVANRALSPAIVPLAIVILIGLFSVQRFGTGKIGIVFGLVMVGWFVSLAVVGAPWIALQPKVLLALNPYYAARFFVDNGFMKHQT